MCHCSISSASARRVGEMFLFLSLAGKKMQQCSLEAEEVKKRFAFPGSAF